MSKITRLEEKMLVMEDKLQRKERPRKKFKPSYRLRSLIKQSTKSDTKVLVEYLTQKGVIRWKLCSIVSGDLVVIANKAHRLNPKAMWTWGKYRVYIIREIDRLPVSNEDYNELETSKRDTASDVPLIKAVLGAVQKKAVSMAGKKGIIIFVVLAILAIVLYFLFRGG